MHGCTHGIHMQMHTYTHAISANTRICTLNHKITYFLICNHFMNFFKTMILSNVFDFFLENSSKKINKFF